MNRRRLLVALAVAVPLALFVPSKIAASWRPAKVAVLVQPGGLSIGLPTLLVLRATSREVVSPGTGNICDLQTQQVRELKSEGVTANGSALWQFKGGCGPQIVVRPDAKTERAYALPAADADELNALAPSLDGRSFTVAANAERVELAVGAHYYRWNAASRVLERSTNCDLENSLENRAIARDGESIINAGLSQISALSTKSGEFTRHTKVPTTTAEGAQISAFGTYALYTPLMFSNAATWRIRATEDARELWQFGTNSSENPVALSPDEKWLAIARGDRKIWEIRDLPTGQIIRTLPLVPATNMGAFSPDGATLYSVADGVLYRQRAR